jgi:hypothetical protein
MDILGSVVVAAVISAAMCFFVAERKLKREDRLENMAETAAATLLTQKPYRTRSFEMLKYHLAGFEDDELRKILVRCGAVRWLDAGVKEFWGGLNRNRAWLSEESLPEGKASEITAGVEPAHRNEQAATRPRSLAHDVSILLGVGRHLGSQPRANTSMTIM